MSNDLQFPNVWLTDLETLKRHRSNAQDSASWSADDDLLLSDFIEQASADVVGELGWLPLPYVDTVLIDYSNEYISRDSKELWLFPRLQLLEITTITNGDGTTFSASDYALQPNNRYPAKRIKLLSSKSKYWKPKDSGQWEQAISLTGIFGFVPHYEYTWLTRDYTVQNETEIASSGTSLEVGAGNATNFSVGDYLKLEDEVVFVSAVDTDADALTIKRGQLGTTATAHGNETSIRHYDHDNIIKRATTEWAAYLLDTKDALGQQVQTFDGGVSIVNGLSKTVYTALSRRMKVSATGG